MCYATLPYLSRVQNQSPTVGGMDAASMNPMRISRRLYRYAPGPSILPAPAVREAPEASIPLSPLLGRMAVHCGALRRRLEGLRERRPKAATPRPVPARRGLGTPAWRVRGHPLAGSAVVPGYGAGGPWSARLRCSPG